MTRAPTVASRPPQPWELAVVLPSQMTNRSWFTAAPEKLLAAAVLEDAVQCITNANGRSTRRMRDFFDACDWFSEDSRDWPYAFGNLCDFLDLDSAAIRQRVRGLVAAQVDRLGDVARRRPAPRVTNPPQPNGRRRRVRRLGRLRRSVGPSRGPNRTDPASLERYLAGLWDEV